MKIRAILTLFILSVSLSLTASELQQENRSTLHLIMIADTEDLSIGMCCELDLFHMNREAKRIAYYADLQLQVTELAGPRDFNTARMLQVFEELEVGSDDVIFFYYTGHGYRVESKESDWPALFFSWYSPNPELGWITEVLVEKGARFTIVMGDCCNNIMDERFAPPILKANLKTASHELVEYNLQRNYFNLYRTTHGSLTVASSEVGEYSLASKLRGGYFTAAWLDVLDDVMRSDDDVTWDEVLQLTFEDLNEVAETQHPIWLLGPESRVRETVSIAN